MKAAAGWSVLDYFAELPDPRVARSRRHSLLTGISALAWLMGKAMSRMLDGLTGDCYGAANKTAEVAILIAAVAMLPYGLLAAAHQIWR